MVLVDAFINPSCSGTAVVNQDFRCLYILILGSVEKCSAAIVHHTGLVFPMNLNYKTAQSMQLQRTKVNHQKK